LITKKGKNVDSTFLPFDIFSYYREIEGCEKIFSRARDMKRHMEKVVHPTREMKKAAKLKAIPNTNLIK